MSLPTVGTRECNATLMFSSATGVSISSIMAMILDVEDLD